MKDEDVRIDFAAFARDLTEERRKLNRDATPGFWDVGSLRAVAAQAGVAPSTFKRVADGVLVPSAVTYAKLCRWMECSLDKYVRPKLTNTAQR